MNAAILSNRPPRVVVAGLSGGSGKTIVTLALARALSRIPDRAQTGSSRIVKPYKKGPDYIDAAWLSLAAGLPCTNLDPFLLPPDRLLALFLEKAQGADLCLIEGNRGLFDGKDVEGTCSTAQLARQIQSPIILVLDATKMTRTAAAILHGLTHFEPETPLAGVILNRTAGERHRSILTRSIEAYTDLKVIGCLPKLDRGVIPERHMGLTSHLEQAEEGAKSNAGANAEATAVAREALDHLAGIAEEWLDLDQVMDLASGATALENPEIDLWPEPVPGATAAAGATPVRIGYVHDPVLWFYYPENLEALERAGAELVRLSLLDGEGSEPWPELHGLYLGGGFPETHAQALSANTAMHQRLCGLAEGGLPIYAECGGFMVLCSGLEVDGREYPMAGVLPLSTGFCPRPQGLGYTEARVVEANPFFEVGSLLKGHEFHYSRCLAPLAQGTCEDGPRMALVMERGQGMLHGLDGVLSGNTYAAYNHVFALSEPQWAPRFVTAAMRYRDGA